jgi:predicted PurR-regulated permease PerM
MKREYLLVALFLLIAAIFLYLFYRIIIPFFVPITWAAVFVIIFFPLYEWVCKKVKSRGLASLLLCLFIVILIIGPITYLFAALVNEAADAVAKVNGMYKSGQLDKILAIDLPWIDAVKQKLNQYYDLSKVNLDELIKDSIDRVAGIIFNQTSWLIANATKTIFYFILMVFTMYYFFKDGKAIIGKIKKLMPISPEQVELTFCHLRDVIQATMYGGVVVALIQGLLGGILFAVVGIPSAVFWGAIMAFLSLIPFLGAFIVYVPAGIILLLGGSYIKGIVVIAVGTLVISQSDNVIRPYLISGRTSMHPLMLFFAIMGGIYLFGLLGIVVGPLIAAVFVTLLRIFEFKLHPQEELEAEHEPAAE